MLRRVTAQRFCQVQAYSDCANVCRLMYVTSYSCLKHGRRFPFTQLQAHMGSSHTTLAGLGSINTQRAFSQYLNVHGRSPVQVHLAHLAHSRTLARGRSVSLAKQYYSHATLLSWSVCSNICLPSQKIVAQSTVAASTDHFLTPISCPSAMASPDLRSSVVMLLSVLLLSSLSTASAAKCRRVTVIVDDGNCPRGFENTVGAACANRCGDIPKYTPEGTGCR